MVAILVLSHGEFFAQFGAWRSFRQKGCRDGSRKNHADELGPKASASSDSTSAAYPVDGARGVPGESGWSATSLQQQIPHVRD
jgi:hypothetical protein